MAILVSGCGGSDDKSESHSTTSAGDTESFADLVEQVQTGVIRIEADTCTGSGIGTGFLISPRLVATVEHVVSGATSIRLLRDGRAVGSATVIGVDATRDLALLRTSESVSGYRFKLAAVAPRLGDEVAALGFPLGLPLTVTKGSVSGQNRTVPIEGVERRRLVQTDAAVNHGNSGGPLLSTTTGDVVGLVDLLTTEANGIAYAVSAVVAAPLIAAWRAAPQPVSALSCEGGTSPPVGSASGSGEVSDYVDAVDGALIDSARTRGNLGDLISQVNARSISHDRAREEIDLITDQHRTLLRAVSAVATPAPLQDAASLLQASLVTSIQNDLAIRDWIESVFAGDNAAAGREWRRQTTLSESATRAKEAFLDEYNVVRRRELGLAPLDVAY